MAGTRQPSHQSLTAGLMPRREGKQEDLILGQWQERGLAPSSAQCSPCAPPPHALKEAEGKKLSEGQGRDSTCGGEQEEQPEGPHGSQPWQRRMRSALCKIPAFPCKAERRGSGSQALPTGTGSWGLSNSQDWGLAL